MELFKILLRHLKSGAWYVLTKGYEIVGFVVKILKIIIFETLRIPFLLVNKLVLLFWKIVRFPFLVTIKILGYVIFMFSVFFGPSHKSSKIGARFLAIICLALTVN